MFKTMARKVFDDLNEKLLDLGIDDENGSGLVPDILAKQEKFKTTLNKKDFEFQTGLLDLP